MDRKYGLIMEFVNVDYRTNYLHSEEMGWGVGEVTGWLGEDAIIAVFEDGRKRELSLSHYQIEHGFHFVQPVLSGECLTYLNSRGIEHLVHFTHIDNVPRIIKEGVRPRSLQEPMGIWSDDQRLDGNTDYSCFSLSYPNYRMLYKKNKVGEKAYHQYVILLIDPSVLAVLPIEKVMYFQNNAASTLSKKNQDRYGINALKLLFADEVTSNEGIIIKRSEQNISDEYTTDPQAEIQISAIIPAQYIKKIVTRDESAEKWLHAIVPNREISIHSDASYFWPRKCWSVYETKRMSGGER